MEAVLLRCECRTQNTISVKAGNAKGEGLLLELTRADGSVNAVLRIPPGITDVAYTFAFLEPATRFAVTLKPFPFEPGDRVLAGILTSTLHPEVSFRNSDPRLYVGTRHPLGEFVHRAPENYLWTRGDLEGDDAFIFALIEQGLFFLGSQRPCYPALLPNPKVRFCLILNSASPPINWRRSRRVRTAIKSGRYRLRCSFDRAGVQRGLNAVRRAHERPDGSVWLTDGLVQTLARQSEAKGAPFQHVVFELLEEGEVVAVVGGTGRGCCWHDFTAATLKRDNSRAGMLLTKCVGELLQRCGYRLWYWGMLTEGTQYMADYQLYGGANLNRETFVPFWRAMLESQPQRTPTEGAAQGLSMFPLEQPVPRPSVSKRVDPLAAGLGRTALLATEAQTSTGNELGMHVAVVAAAAAALVQGQIPQERRMAVDEGA
eukprot:Hpha_TRINITY_DN35070_c0_g1::TRINITY_DN35070_c0_g1_i1::g.82627::m.82627